MGVELLNIPSSRITETTISKIHSFIKNAKTDYKFINLIRWIVRYYGAEAKNGMQEMDAIYESFNHVIRYFLDPHQVELVSSVWETMNNSAGDCDDQALLLSASAEQMPSWDV